MNDLERRLFDHFANNYPRPDCPDDMSLIEYTEGSSVCAYRITIHLKTCLVCQTRLKEIIEIQQTGHEDTSVHTRLNIDRERIYARLTAQKSEVRLAFPDFSLAADTAKCQPPDLSFSSAAGDLIIRCRNVKRKIWEFILISPGIKPRVPVIMVINGLIVKPLYANKLTQISDIPEKRDDLNKIEIIEPFFYFSGQSDDRKDRLDERFSFTELAGNKFSIKSADEASTGNKFYIRYHADNLILGRLPMTGELGEELNLCLYDLSTNITQLEKLD